MDDSDLERLVHSSEGGTQDGHTYNNVSRRCISEVSPRVYHYNITSEYSKSQSHHKKRSGNENRHGAQHLGKIPVLMDSGMSAVEHWRASPSVLADFLPESTSMRKLIHVQPKAIEKYRNAEDTLVDDTDEEDKIGEPKVVAVVLAFQRWRHTQLKSIFSQELKKVLEEARQDEACLATLEGELESSEQHLAMALADSAKLRAQLSMSERTYHHEQQIVDSSVKEIDREMLKAIEGVVAAEAEVHRRDGEIRRLTDRLKCREEQDGRVDGELLTNVSQLQRENYGALEENGILLEQLARRDQELGMRGEELERLQVVVARLADLQTMHQQHIESLKTEHNAEIQSLQDQLRQAYGAKYAKEMDLASFAERCSGLSREREELMLQLHHAVERADLASCRAEELQLKLHCTAEERAKVSEEVALEMVKHLKRLTGHMREFESSVNWHSFPFREEHLSYDGLDKRATVRQHGCKVTKVAKSEDLSHGLTMVSSNAEGVVEDYQTWGEGNRSPKRHVCFSPVSEQQAVRPQLEDTSSTSFLPERDRDLKAVKHWTAWKWRWAASAARAELLGKRLHGMGVQNGGKEDTHLVHEEDKASKLAQRLRSAQFGNLTTSVKKAANYMSMECKLVPLILSAWRAFARTCILEKKTISRQMSLDKMMEALPGWVRRVAERRQMERNFFRWQLLTLRESQPAKPQKPKKHQLVIDSTLAHAKAHSNESALVASCPVVELDIPNASVPRNLGIIQADRKASSVMRGSGASQQRRAVTGFSSGCPVRTLSHNLGVGRKVSAVTRTGSKDNDPVATDGMTFTARALRALQISLQQEVIELQTLLTQEMQSLQLQGPSKSEGEATRASIGRHQGPERKRTLNSVWGVCNNLAQALSDVHGQISSNGAGGSKTRVNRPRTAPGDRSWEVEKARASTRPASQGPVPDQSLRQGHPTAIQHQFPWGGRGMNIASPCRRSHPSPSTPNGQSQYCFPPQEGRNQHPPPASQGGTPYLSPSHKGQSRYPNPLQGCRGSRSPHVSPYGRVQHHSPVHAWEGGRPESFPHLEEGAGCVSKTIKNEAVPVKVSPEDCEPTQTTIVKIIPDGDNISEVIIHTEASGRQMEPTPAEVPTKKTKKVCQASMVCLKKPSVDRAVLASLKKKNCIGTEYAAFLNAEILRLREGRGADQDRV